MCISFFVLALLLMKEGAKPMETLIRGVFSVNSTASALGFGWLGASFALSGSPVAATALSLLDAKVLNPPETFAMLAGSRLGAAFMVLLLGFIYTIRGKERQVSLGVGLISLLVTQTFYPVVLLIGLKILSFEWFLPFQAPNQEINTIFEQLLTPVMRIFITHFPPGAMLAGGFLLALFSLWLFDRVIPDLNLKDTNLGLVAHLLYRPGVVFLMGGLVTAFTMSVSVSLGLLVPLSVRGFVRQENLIPYIMGANITTFIDTLIAAILLGNPVAIKVVLIQMLSVALISLVILSTNFRLYERLIQNMAIQINKRSINLLVYILLILGLPFGLLWLG